MPAANFTRLPDELILKVAFLLPLNARLRLSAVARRLHTIIKTSLLLDYTTEQECLGVILNSSPSAPLVNLSQRFSNLRSWEQSWSTLSWNRKSLISLGGPMYTYELCGGVFSHALSMPGQRTNTLHFIDLPTAEHAEPIAWSHDNIDMFVRDFTFDPSQDLLVLIEEDHSVLFHHSFRVHLRSLSDNLSHPAAPTSVFEVPFEELWLADDAPESTKFTIQIFNDVLGVVCRIYPATSDVLAIWNWTTGQSLCYFMSDATRFDDFTFLSSTEFLVTYGRSYDSDPTPAFNIYTLDPHRCTGAMGGATLRAILKLPSHVDHVYSDLSVHCNPAATYPQSTYTGSTTRYRSQSQTHHTDPRARVLSFCLTAIAVGSRGSAGGIQETSETFIIFANQRNIQETVERVSGSTAVSSGQSVPWEHWGPRITRWLTDLPTYGWAICSRGYRHACLVRDPSLPLDNEDEPSRHLRVLDFNPINNSRRLHSMFGHPTDTTFGSTRRVVATPTSIPAGPFFENDIVSTLSYHEVTSLTAVSPGAGGVLVDDQRVIVMKVFSNEADDPDPSLEVLTFS